MVYTVRSKDCRFCKLGHSKEDHDCHKNYDESAKSMEPHMAVELFKNNSLFDKENVCVNTIIGDEDSCTIASLKSESTHQIIKWSDFNHIKKGFTSHLYNLKMSQNLIQYYGKNFSIAIKENKGNPVKVKEALEAIVPHSFGDHHLCSTWCEATNNVDYVHNNLPNGKPLSDLNLKLKLTKLISNYTTNVDKIAMCGSTQSNESFNQIVSSKNPKARHYSSSDSLSIRVSAAVCQENIGNTYSTRVFEKLGYKQSLKSTSVQKKRQDSRN